jgi:lipopolysaccharide/colanic/teichoic acid biosynthesis glycosyltransferase
MHSNKGSEVTNYNDKRITKIGQFLRKLKLDELPQLINIIRGDMVFIGPRPEIVGIVSKYPEYFSYLEYIKPGISDINSIIFRDETKLFKNIDINKYEDEILPLKNHLALITSKNQKIIKQFMLIFLSIFSVIFHKVSLRIISRFFLPYNETEFRIKLNYLLSVQIF